MKITIIFEDNHSDELKKPEIITVSKDSPDLYKLENLVEFLEEAIKAGGYVFQGELLIE